MSKQEREFLDDIRAKSVEAAADMVAGLQRLKSLHEEFAGEDFEPNKVHVADFLYKLAKLELEHASNILSLGNAQAEMLFEQVRRLARRARGGAPANRVLELMIEKGKLMPAGRLEIRNPFDRRADVRFEVGTLRRQDGSVDDELQLKPRCDGDLPPHGTASVIVGVDGGDTLDVGDVRFGELVIFVSAEIETEVARRLVKVKVNPGASERTP